MLIFLNGSLYFSALQIDRQLRDSGTFRNQNHIELRLPIHPQRRQRLEAYDVGLLIEGPLDWPLNIHESQIAGNLQRSRNVRSVGRAVVGKWESLPSDGSAGASPSQRPNGVSNRYESARLAPLVEWL